VWYWYWEFRVDGSLTLDDMRLQGSENLELEDLLADEVQQGMLFAYERSYLPLNAAM
jgi:hypothetical protein